MSTLRTTFSPIAQTLTTIFGLLIATPGLRSMFSTRAYLQDFGLPHTSKAPITVASNPWIQLTAARNIMLGTVIMAFQYQGDVRAMGTLFLCGLVVSGADGYVKWHYGVRKAAWSHIVSTVFAGVLGGYLIWVS